MYGYTKIFKYRRFRIDYTAVKTLIKIRTIYDVIKKRKKEKNQELDKFYFRFSGSRTINRLIFTKGI